MASLLEVIVTFVGAVLVLALAAQSLQEVVKASIAIKSGARVTAVKRLITESTTAVGLLREDAAAIIEEVVKRLGNLGQPAIRWNPLSFLRRSPTCRLDVLDADRLRDLIQDVPPKALPSFKDGDKEHGEAELAKVAAKAHEWFDLAIDPVSDRHERRMKLGALVAGLAVVLAVNANAFWIMDHARNDPAFRANVAAQVDSLSAPALLVQALDDSLARDTASTDTAFDAMLARRDSAAARRDTLVFRAMTGGGALFPGYDNWRFEWTWVLGILISALLVGLGAPFWHDLLSSLVGVKERVKAQAKQARQAAEEQDQGAGGGQTNGRAASSARSRVSGRAAKKSKPDKASTLSTVTE